MCEQPVHQTFTRSFSIILVWISYHHDDGKRVICHSFIPSTFTSWYSSSGESFPFTVCSWSLSLSDRYGFKYFYFSQWITICCYHSLLSQMWTMGVTSSWLRGSFHMFPSGFKYFLIIFHKKMFQVHCMLPPAIESAEKPQFLDI